MLYSTNHLKKKCFIMQNVNLANMIWSEIVAIFIFIINFDIYNKPPSTGQVTLILKIVSFIFQCEIGLLICNISDKLTELLHISIPAAYKLSVFIAYWIYNYMRVEERTLVICFMGTKHILILRIKISCTSPA